MVSKIYILLSAFLLSSALACRCRKPTLPTQYYEADVVNFVKATVISKTPAATQTKLIQYTISINKNFKGCAPPSTVKVYTPASGAACGVFLEVGKQYVLPIRSGITPEISLCDFISEYSLLSDADRSFLETRFVCCFKRCMCASGDPPVNCFRQPCDPRFESPPCEDASKCVDNYCGGCFAEWFNDDGFPACL